MQNQNPLYVDLNENIDAIERLGAILARSGCFKCDREEQGVTILCFCISMNITLMEFSATYDMVDGVPRKKAMACLADFKKRGGKWEWLTAAEDQEKATAVFSFEEQEYKVTFTIDDAKQQFLVKPNSNWVKSPPYMLRARVTTTAIGMLAPEIVAGADAGADGSDVSTTRASLDLMKGSEEQPGEKKPEKTDEQAESDMGLAPAKPPAEPEKPKSKPKAAAKPKKAKRTSISTPAPSEDGEESEGPIPPAPATIEPEGATKKEEPAPPTETISPETGIEQETVNKIGFICQGHFLEVANWMIREKWIPPSKSELKTEGGAGAHLQLTLPNLTPAKAKKILAQKLAFMRAVANQDNE